MTTSAKCQAQGGAVNCTNPNCPEKRAYQAEVDTFIADMGAKYFPASLARSIGEQRYIERSHTRRAAEEVLESELGGQFKPGWLEISKSGERFFLVVEASFTHKDMKFDKNDRVEFDQSGEIVGWAGYGA